MKQLLILFSLFTHAAFAKGPVVSFDIPSDQVIQWNTEKSNEGTECKHISDIPGTYVCLMDFSDMIATFARASFFVEQAPQHTLVGEKDLAFQHSPPVTSYGGHDLNSQDLLTFFSASKKACKKNHAYCLNSHETFLRHLVAKAKSRGFEKSVIIGIAATSISHELRHARYFLNEGYRKTVNEFWNTVVSPEDRQLITQRLGVIYDANNTDLIINEFQAYLLQDGMPGGRVRYFTKYRAPLMMALHS
jgi:hypothetical protein